MIEKRPIKFRAWDILNQRMLSTNISIDFVHNICHIFDEKIKDSSTFITDFIPLEFTGLKDISGADLFEGDFIRIIDTVTLEVEYSKVYFVDGTFCYDDWAYGDKYKCPYDLNAVCSVDGKNHKGSHFCEKLGNIYENSDLLK